MGSFFRSEDMVLCQLFLQPEAAYTSIAQLGEMGVVQFRDLNTEVSSFQRKFVSEVRRHDELERKLRYIETEMVKDGFEIPEAPSDTKVPNPRESADLENHLEKTESELLEVSQNAVNLKNNFLELTELRHVLEKTKGFFDEQESSAHGESGKSLIHDEAGQQSTRARLGFVAGVIERERVPAFERMLWRISRGNVFLRQAELNDPLEDPTTGHQIYKTVFVAFFQGEQLKSRVRKVCAGFHASVYPCPHLPEERAATLEGVRTRLADLNMVLNQTQDHRLRVLTSAAKDLQKWTVMVRKMKAIYHALNMFNMDVTQKCLIGECWAPLADLQRVRQALADGSKEVGSSIPSFLQVIDTKEVPPTYNRTNKFTKAFQKLIDSYGVSSYGEVNPALYTIITFPFLFAVMFGDAGHGLIVTLFGLWMVLKEKSLMKIKTSSEFWNILFGGRYIILLMGLFSIYTGFIYNDVLSRGMNIFGSRWINPYNATTLSDNENLEINPYEGYLGTPYYFGIDPAWMLAENKIIFLNSYKMKMSIIFGVVHMIFGVCLSVVNHRHFGNKIYILLEFVPQLLFLVLLFAYMAFMMLIKWWLYGPFDEQRWSPGCAPSILITFINMLLQSKSEVLKGCETEFMYPYQYWVQIACVLLAVLCVPVMLFGKPIYLSIKNKRAQKRESLHGHENPQGIELSEELGLNPEPAKKGMGHGGHDDDEEFSFGEAMVHQSIHTIEYVLSTVSHTASYLRLWALSLAHSQLSEVLWTKVLKIGFSISGPAGPVAIFLIFGAWACLTISILVLMEGLSAFLHTLRLHWVEFMNKFYQGEGYAFAPFSFKKILKHESSEEDA
ncbi:Hypothetical predicted protein [Cloeon dipterum]|uniref:V-type proton ATPase subunit a n=1 Tax=Cloeon dipterum TaxID=197152 RepID=A0A8S1BN23_9INSE|nr:Hypothetical predicted protein [Cloeon dipterum]